MYTYGRIIFLIWIINIYMLLISIRFRINMIVHMGGHAKLERQIKK